MKSHGKTKHKTNLPKLFNNLDEHNTSAHCRDSGPSSVSAQCRDFCSPTLCILSNSTLATQWSFCLHESSCYWGCNESSLPKHSAPWQGNSIISVKQLTSSLLIRTAALQDALSGKYNELVRNFSLKARISFRQNAKPGAELVNLRRMQWQFIKPLHRPTALVWSFSDLPRGGFLSSFCCRALHSHRRCTKIFPYILFQWQWDMEI